MHTRHLTHDHFDTAMYDLYWQFLCERQRIWVRRAHLKLDRPWTTDRTLNYEFITNVYRELDPGTEYVLDVLCAANDLPIDKIFNVMVYRLMGSQISTSASLGFIKHDEFTMKKYMRNLGGLSGNIFGDAYRVAGYGEGTGSKLENVGQVIAELAKSMPEWYRRMSGSANARDLFNVFSSIQGFGTFLSNQCMVDALMLDEADLLSTDEDRQWSFGTNEWCEPGPGAKRGIAKLLVPGVKPANLHMVMAWLRDAQVAEWDRLGLQFPFLLNKDDEPKLLTICNIQTTLCEFSKYVRSRGHVNVRAYHSVPSLLEPFDVALDEDEIEALRDITTCTGAESMYVAPVEADVEELEPAPVQRTAIAVTPDDVEYNATLPGQPRIPIATPPILVPNVAQASELEWLRNLMAPQAAQQKPIVIPVDPTGLLGLPKAIVIVPIW